MPTNDTKQKNNQQKLTPEQLNNYRKKWLEDKQTLDNKKKELGFEQTDLKQFLDPVFLENLVTNIKDQPKISAVLALHNQFKELYEKLRLLWPKEYIIHEFNKKHAVVHTNQTYILTEKLNALGCQDFTLESRASLKAFYEDEVVLCSDGKYRNKADIWLKSPKRRKFTGITFDPTQKGHSNGMYNIWKGFTRIPKQSSPHKWWAHVQNNICAGNAEHYKHLRKWLAYIFQRPDEVHTALVLCGSQGVGKNSFVEPLGFLLGQHYVLLSSISELVSNFNYHLKNAVLIHANEALWGGNKKEIGTVKAMITERICLIEGKGKDRITVNNFKHLILSSNEDWPVHIDPDDRRFLVLRVSEAHKEDHAYFAQIQFELDNGGYEGLLYDLLNEDLAGFNPRHLPHSAEAFSIKLRSTESSMRYLYTALCEGSLNPGDKMSSWEEAITLENLYTYYKTWCEKSGEVSTKRNVFFASLIKCFPSAKKSRPSINAKRTYTYQLPSLIQAREEFCKSFKADYQDVFEKYENEESI